MSVNRVFLLGRVGQIEVNEFNGQNGPRKCAQFSFATTEKYRDRNGNQIENTEWHNIVSWNHAELCEKYVQKGSQLYIEGKLRTRSWEDQNGNKKYVTEILAEKIALLGQKENSQSKQPQQQAPALQPQQHSQQHPQYHNNYGSTPIPGAGDPQDDDMPF